MSNELAHILKEHDVDDFYTMSGISADSAENENHSTTVYSSTKLSTPLHIDLYNLEEPQFEDSEYVLTSPRSLEACSILQIKPIELLHKPLEEFQEELLPRNIPLRTLYEIYEEHEKERQNKLELCREERERLIEEDLRREGPYVFPDAGLSSERDVFPTKDSSPRISVKKVTVTEGKSDSFDEGSLQHQHTAWTRSIGITQEELDQRAQELFEKGNDLKHSFSKEMKVIKKAKPKKKTSKRPKSSSVLISRKSSAQINERQHKSQQNGLHKKNYSISNLSTSSTRSERTSWHHGAAIEAYPITNTTLYGKFKSAKSPTTRLLPRDQKILELMLAKREEDRQLSAQREAAQAQWEQERKCSTVMTPSRQWKSFNESRKSQDDPKKAALQHHNKEEEHECCHKNWTAQSEAQLRLKEQKIAVRREQNLLRKKSVEHRLEQKQREEEEARAALLAKQKKEILRAQSAKEAREQEQAKQRKLKSYYTKKKVEERKNEIEKQTEEERQYTQAQIEMKQSKTTRRLSDQLLYKNSNLRKSQHDLEKRLNKSRKNKEKLEKDLESWHKDLLKYRQMCEVRAEQVAHDKVEEKRRRAQEERLNKEKQVRENMKKLMEQEEEWKADVEATIAIKDARSKMLQMEKEETVQELRAMAEASQRLREELRSAYCSDHIDQMSKQAEMEARLGTGVNQATKNMSSLMLG